jgi:hypothetical protein
LAVTVSVNALRVCAPASLRAGITQCTAVGVVAAPGRGMGPPPPPLLWLFFLHALMSPSLQAAIVSVSLIVKLHGRYFP